MYGQTSVAGSYDKSFAQRNMDAIPGLPTRTGGGAKEQIDVLTKETERLHDAIARLEGRLQFVLGPMPPASCGNAEKTPAMPTLTFVLRDLTERVSYAAQRINELIDRVDL
jgi:hypothetical protein